MATEADHCIKSENIDVNTEEMDECGAQTEELDVACKTEADRHVKDDVVAHNLTLNTTQSSEDNQSSSMAKPTFACDKCPYTTIRKYNFVQHIVIHQSPKERIKYNCKLCVFVTIHKKSLTRHLLTHSRNRPEVFRCELCQFDTKNESSLRRHRRVHRNEAMKDCHKSEIVEK